MTCICYFWTYSVCLFTLVLPASRFIVRAEFEPGEIGLVEMDGVRYASTQHTQYTTPELVRIDTIVPHKKDYTSVEVTDYEKGWQATYQVRRSGRSTVASFGGASASMKQNTIVILSRQSRTCALVKLYVGMPLLYRLMYCQCGILSLLTPNDAD